MILATAPLPTRVPRSATPVLPREHGAYGLLLLPLASALVARPPSVGALALAASFVGAFLSHGPLLGLLRGRPASRPFAAVAVLAALAISVALVTAPLPALLAMLVPAALAPALLLLRMSRPGGAAFQVLATVALPSCAVPVALASGAPAREALVLALVWVGGFGALCAAVRGAIVRGASRPRAALVVAAVGAFALLVPDARSALLPFLALSAALLLRPASPARPRVIGWSAVAASVVALAVLALGSP